MTSKTVAAASLMALTGATAGQAATIFATGASILTEGLRGMADGRNVIGNALGSTFSTCNANGSFADPDFFEPGVGAVVDFTFGRNFTSPGSIIEVTLGSRAGFLETAIVSFSLNGGPFQQAQRITNAASTIVLNFSGVFGTLQIENTTPRGGARSGGFDVDRIGVSSVPVPAAGLLLGALGVLGRLRRRRG